MSDPPQYSYSPLPAEHIRLLQITQADEQILCSLAAVPLSKPPDFDAISYCWGSENPTSTITCDGAAFKVSPHLFEGLRCIFASAGSTWVWIDAICINQADTAEKTLQVARMWNVYTTATKVVVWLGPSQDNSDAAFDAIPQLCLDFAKIPEGAKRGQTLQTFVLTFGLPSITDPIWIALEHLYRRPWFQRLWVVQETILAQELYVMCGTKRLHWNQLCTVSESILTSGFTMKWRAATVKECRKAMMFVGYMELIRKDRRIGNIPASTLLHISRSQDTKEPIDRVYGILGIMRPEISQRIHVDYSVESRAQFWRAYVELFRILLIDEGPRMLAILSSAIRNPDLPSWCPDLNQPASTQRIPFFGYSAGGTPAEHGLTIEKITACPDSDEVLIPGISVDTLIDTADLTDLDHWNGMPSGVPSHYGHMARADTRGRALLDRVRPRFDFTISQYARALVANHDWNKSCEYPTGQIEEHYEETFRAIRTVAAPGYDGQTPNPNRKSPFLNSLTAVMDGRSLFVTENGRIGVGPRVMRPGDHVCVFFSGYCPWILRREAGASTYRLLGDAYTEGLMKGEIYDLFDIKKDGYEKFRVV